MNKHLIILDGNSLVYRAFYASYNNSEDYHNNALKTFIKMYYKLVDVSCQHVIVVFDGPRPSYRLDVYKDYKATRKERPEGLTEQMELIKEFLLVIKVKTLVSDIYEADDYIGTLSKRWSKIGQSTIVTSDKDLLQLIDDKTNVKLIKSMSNIVDIDIDNIKDEVGVSPEKFILLKSIAGDPADNIRGIKGVGTKGALELANLYNSFDEIFSELKNNPSKIEKYRKRLEESKEDAYTSEFLTKIVTNVELGEFKIKDVKVKEVEWLEVEEFYIKNGI